MGIIKVKDLIYEYIRRDEEGNVEGITTAVDNVSLDIRQGDFVAVLGHNGKTLERDPVSHGGDRVGGRKGHPR